MTKPKVIAVSSQSDDDRYNKKAALEKVKKQGVTPLILRLYREDDINE